MKAVPPGLHGGVLSGLLCSWDAEERASHRGGKGASHRGGSIPQGREDPTGKGASHRGGRVLLLNSRSPFHHDGLGFWQWCTGFEVVSVLITCCAWETLIPPQLRTAVSWGFCLEEQSTSDGVKIWVVGIFSPGRDLPCATPSTALAFLFVIFLWLHHILGEAYECLNKIKFLKSKLNQPEPKPVVGHESTSLEFWGDELHFAAYHGCGTQPAWFPHQADFGTCQGELCCRVCCSWGTQGGLTGSHLFFITLCSSNINTKVCGHCCGQGEPDAKGIPPRLYKLQEINILETVF